jgi:hypothetical protein
VPVAREGVVHVGANPRDDLDLRGDELATDGGAQHGVLQRGVVQALVSRDEVERVGMQDGELLLQADGVVFGLGEDGRRLLEIQPAHGGGHVK